jgi:CBS domain containing-hemolysin-like protein
MHLLAALPLFIVCTALAGFFGAAVAGLTTLGRLLEERDREPRPVDLPAFLLRDANFAVTSWVVGGLWAAVGAALALGSTAARHWGALPGAFAIALAQLLCAASLLVSLLLWKQIAVAVPRVYCDVAALLALPFFLLLYPLRQPLVAALVRLYPPLDPRDGMLSTADIDDIAADDDHPRLLDRDEREMIHRVIGLDETVVREIMVPRIDIVALEESTPIAEVIRVIQSEGHTRLPVYRDSVDNVVGFLYSKDLITHYDRLAEVRLQELVRPTHFVPETKRVGDLLAEMRERRAYLAMVVDEYGGTAGLVTLEDVIEEVVGEIHDELDEEQKLIHPLEDGSYRVDAKVDLDDLNDRLQVALPADEYDTLGGFLYGLAGNIPAVGDRFTHEELEFTIGGVRGKRITQVHLRRRRPAEPAGPPEGAAT